jgi:hypothetical protein
MALLLIPSEHFIACDCKYIANCHTSNDKFFRNIVPYTSKDQIMNAMIRKELNVTGATWKQ